MGDRVSDEGRDAGEAMVVVVVGSVVALELLDHGEVEGDGAVDHDGEGDGAEGDGDFGGGGAVGRAVVERGVREEEDVEAVEGDAEHDEGGTEELPAGV